MTQAELVELLDTLDEAMALANGIGLTDLAKALSEIALEASIAFVRDYNDAA